MKSLVHITFAMFFLQILKNSIADSTIPNGEERVKKVVQTLY